MKNTFLFLLIVVIVSCQTSEEPIPPSCDNSTLSFTLSNIQPSSCGADDGSFEVKGSGGSGNYQYKLGTNGSYGNSGIFTGLSSANYTVFVSDGTCETQGPVAIGNGSGLSINSVQIDASGCGGTNGALTVQTTGGGGNVQFKINALPFQTESSFNNLEAGEYTILVQDQQNCNTSQTVRVGTGVTFSAQVSNIISTNCAVSGCHVANQPRPDFTIFSNVQSRADLIKTRVNNGSMPPSNSGLSLSQSEIDLISCWVNDGADNN